MTETDWAIENLRLAGVMGPGSDYDGMIGEAVEELLRTLQRQGHSGGSHTLTVQTFTAVASGIPLTKEYADARRQAFKEFAEENGGGVDDSYIERLYPYPDKV